MMTMTLMMTTTNDEDNDVINNCCKPVCEAAEDKAANNEAIDNKAVEEAVDEEAVNDHDEEDKIAEENVEDNDADFNDDNDDDNNNDNDNDKNDDNNNNNNNNDDNNGGGEERRCNPGADSDHQVHRLWQQPAPTVSSLPPKSRQGLWFCTPMHSTLQNETCSTKRNNQWPLMLLGSARHQKRLSFHPRWCFIANLLFPNPRNLLSSLRPLTFKQFQKSAACRHKK
jgi:hypothetical protein